MRFNPINYINLGIIAVIMIPNIIYAIRFSGKAGICRSRLLNISEQVGRYLCILLMFFPVLVREFGFSSTGDFLIYAFSNSILLAAYLIIWIFYFRSSRKMTAIHLAVIPALIFLITGLLLHHWLLVGAAVLFGVSHISVTALSFAD